MRIGSNHEPSACPEASAQHSPADDIKLRKHSGNCTAESSDIVLHLAGVNKHRGLGVAGDARWRSAARLDEADGSMDGWKREVSSFDHPGGKLDDLFCRQSLLLDQLANRRVTDPERFGCLLHRDPEALLGRWTCRQRSDERRTSRRLGCYVLRAEVCFTHRTCRRR